MKREAKSAATAIASHGRAMARRSQASGRPPLSDLRDLRDLCDLRERGSAAAQPPAASAERSRVSLPAACERAFP